MRVLKKMAMVVAAAGSMCVATAAKANLVTFTGALASTLPQTVISTTGSDTLDVTVTSGVYNAAGFAANSGGFTVLSSAGVSSPATDFFYVYQFTVNGPPLGISDVNAEHFSVGVGSNAPSVPGGHGASITAIGYDKQDTDALAVIPTSANLSLTSSDWSFPSPASIPPGGESYVLVIESALTPAFGSATVSQGTSANVFPLLVPAGQGTTPFPLPRASFGFIGLMVLFGGARLVRSRRNLAL